MTVAGLVLAAGQGKRFGRPKALVRTAGEPLAQLAFRVLHDGGCAPIAVVVGAQADAVRALLPEGAWPVYAPGWETGMGASLRAGLDALAGMSGDDADADPVEAVLIHLVDLPWVGPQVVGRLAALATPDAVARAGYRGAPGHPVLIGRAWWPDVTMAARGDRGARDWLRDQPDLRLVECSDLADGRDVDTPDDLQR